MMEPFCMATFTAYHTDEIALTDHSISRLSDNTPGPTQLQLKTCADITPVVDVCATLW